MPVKERSVAASSLSDVFCKAQRHLSRRDPLLGRLIRRVGPCTLQPGGEAFPMLVRAIISQMLATKAALTITARVEAALQPHGVTPAAIAAASAEGLRGAGLSRAKVLALKDLAQQALNGGLSLERLADKSDEQVIAALVSVRGIGRWTAEMFLFLGILGPHLSDSVLNLYLILGYKNAPGAIPVVQKGHVDTYVAIRRRCRLDVLPSPSTSSG